MLHKLLYFGLLALCCGYALARGGTPERLGAIILLIASVLTPLMRSWNMARFQGLEPSILALDLVALAAFVALALRANRFWPLWIAAIQLLGCTGHIAKALNPAIDPWAYYVMVALGGYPMCLIIAIATRRHRRRMAERGVDPSWNAS